MPTRVFERRKEQSLAQLSGNFGSGSEKHGILGDNNSGDSFRDLIRWQHDWSGVERLTFARLTLQTTGSDQHVPKQTSTITIGRLTASFTEAGGGEGYWDSAGSVYGQHGRSNVETYNKGGADGVTHEFDVTDIVARWLPTDRLKQDGVTPGNGDTNYGLDIRADGDAWEFVGIRGTGQKPVLEITYDDSVKPTIEFISPTDNSQKHVRVLGVEVPTEDMRGELLWTVSYGPTDTLLTTHTYVLDTVPPTIPVSSGNGPLVAGTAVVETPKLTPGAQYALTVTAEGNGGGGVNVRTVSFVFPVGEAVHSEPLGINPSGVGSSVIPSPTGQDVKAVHYAQSNDGTEAGIVGDWSESVPDDWLADVPVYLLIRTRLHRANAAYVPLDPDGIDAIDIAWRGTL